GNEPFRVEYTLTREAFYNVPIFVNISDPQRVLLKVGQDGVEVAGTYGRPVDLQGLTVTVHRNGNFPNEALNCFFVVNSPEVLMNYMLANLSVQPLNFNANTIRISFQDNNPLKASTIVNKIDSLYLYFSNEQKNQANSQKIVWLTNELNQIEEKMGQYETYFEDFILENKTNNLEEDIGKIISLIHGIEYQRYNLTRRIADINELLDGISSGTFFVSATQRQHFPQVVNDNLEKLTQLQSSFD